MNSERPIILITNDDGYDSDGIRKLAGIARRFGKVVIVAPVHQQSGKSSALTSEHPLKLSLVSKEDGLEVYSCNGTPTDCVKLAFFTLFRERRPDLLLSGINHGSNSSVNALYSGTIGAAMEGCVNQISSIAFSCVQTSSVLDDNFSSIVGKMIGETLESPLPSGTMLNVNFPIGEVEGLSFCRQADAKWSEEYVKDADDPDSYHLSGYFDNREPHSEDTDEWALSHHLVSVVPLRVDFTDYDYLNVLKNIYG